MTSNFASAMTKNATTWNGSKSVSTPDPTHECNGRIGLYFKSVRGLNTPRLYEYLREAARENVIDAFLLVFHIRDCRGGKSERELGRNGLAWLFLNYPDEFMRVAHLLAEYGRWDDIIQLWPKVMNLKNLQFVRANWDSPVEDETKLIHLQGLQRKLMTIVFFQLKQDLCNMHKGLSTSLCAKWFTTENSSLDNEYQAVQNFCLFTRMSPRCLRCKFISPLRAYTKIVEGLMCSNRWAEIEYSKVPSCAMKRLKKAFERHEPALFKEWESKLRKGEVDVKGAQLLPHELIQEARQKCCADTVCEAQWKVLEQEAMSMGSLGDSIAVCDVSGSMESWGGSSRKKSNVSFIPKDVAIGLSLLIANATKGEFHNHIITFHDNPTFHVVPNGSLYNRYRSLCSASWGNSTNLQSVFSMVLERAIEARLHQKHMPKRIFIISDMQFDVAMRTGFGKPVSITNFDAIQEKYDQSGYQRPQIVFWNVVGSSNDFPVTINEDGTAMIAGFSIAIMRAIVQGDDFTPYTIMRNTLDGERYGPVRQALSCISYRSVESKTRPVVLFLRGWRYGINKEHVAACTQRIIEKYAEQPPRIITWSGDLLLKSEESTSYTDCLPILRLAFPGTTFVAFRSERSLASLGYTHKEDIAFGVETGYPESFGKSRSYHESLRPGLFYIHPVPNDINRTTEGPNVVRHWLDRNFEIDYVTIGGNNVVSGPAERFANEMNVWRLEVHRENKDGEVEWSQEVAIKDKPK